MKEKINQRKFDAHAGFKFDDEIENLLDEHFKRFGITKNEICRNFMIYSRRLFLKRFLAHYEIFRKTINLPGDIVELGVYRGASLMAWANFLEIFNMGDRAKQVIGFDHWSGFKALDEKDGGESQRHEKYEGGFNASVFEAILKDAIAIYDKDRFIPHKPRVILVDGDIEETVPEFVKENSGLRISILNIDCDLYTPTRTGIEALWPLIVPGGIFVVDDYGVRPWEGESVAVDEYFAEKGIRLHRFSWTHTPSVYAVKE